VANCWYRTVQPKSVAAGPTNVARSLATQIPVHVRKQGRIKSASKEQIPSSRGQRDFHANLVDVEKDSGESRSAWP
jgi:hypothetical protein